jgi:FAD/FMN-containing dehydrogenase
MTTPNSLPATPSTRRGPPSQGRFYVPGQRGCDDARHAWNLFVDQRPVAVVFAESAVDVARTVKFARAQGI